MAKTIESVTPTHPKSLTLAWSDGSRSVHDLSAFIERKKVARPLQSQAIFETVARDPEGFFVFWPGTPIELPTDWFIEGGDRQTSPAPLMSPDDFNGWLEEMDFSPGAAARELDVSIRTIRYYMSGEQPVPKKVFLACMHLAAVRARARDAAAWHAAVSVSEFQTLLHTALTRSAPVVSNDNHLLGRIEQHRSTQELNYA